MGLFGGKKSGGDDNAPLTPYNCKHPSEYKGREVHETDDKGRESTKWIYYCTECHVTTSGPR